MEEIINGLFSFDEKIKIGRRILIAEYVREGYKWEDISKFLKVGKTAILSVMKNLDKNPRCFDLLDIREKKVENEYGKSKYRLVGGLKQIFKTKLYTGFKRKDVQR